jgi:intracellular sulfur oxidation DsrE/DsrF family protein
MFFHISIILPQEVIMSTLTNRRGFLGGIAGSAAALGVASLGVPMKLWAEAASKSLPQNDGPFEAWLSKIKGKHKQVFDAPELNGGMPFAWPRVFYMTNKQVGVPESDLTAVIVIRHDAIPLALDHPLWKQYKLGEFFHIDDEKTKAPAMRNPYYKPAEGELPLPGMSIDELTKSGVLIGACDMALTVFSRFISQGTDMDPEKVKKDWVAGLLPGIQVVPSGVLAVNRAQERGCTYCFAG